MYSFDDDYMSEDSGSGSALDSILGFASKIATPVLAAQFGPQNSGLAVNPQGTAVLPTNTGLMKSGPSWGMLGLLLFVGGLGVFAFYKLT
jgi:hypothetical protein